MFLLSAPDLRALIKVVQACLIEHNNYSMASDEPKAKKIKLEEKTLRYSKHENYPRT